MATAFTSRQQLIRTAIAGLTPAQFAGLRSYLDAVRVHTDARLAQLDAERARLLARKQKLDLALQRFARADAFDALRDALQRGERLKLATPAKGAKSPGKKPAKKPAKRPTRRPGG